MASPHQTPQGTDLWELVGGTSAAAARLSSPASWRTPAMRDYLLRLGISPDMTQPGRPPMVTTLAPSADLSILGSLVIPVAISKDFGLATTLRAFLDPLPQGDPRDPLDVLFSRMHRSRSSPYQAEYRVLGALIGYVDPAISLSAPASSSTGPPPTTPTSRTPPAEPPAPATPPAPSAPGWSPVDFMNAQIGVIFNRSLEDQERFNALFDSPILSPRVHPDTP